MRRVALLFVWCWVVPAGLAAASEQTPLATIQALSDQELAAAQVKLSHLGAQTKPIPSIIFTVHGQKVNWEAFRPWMRMNDPWYQEVHKTEPSFTVSVEELRSFMQNLMSVVTQPRVVTGLSGASLSVTITAGRPPHAKGFEAQLDSEEAKELFILMRASLHADPKDITLLERQANLGAMRTLQSWGCGLLAQEIPARDVTQDVRVVLGRVRWNASTKQFECTAILTNISAKPVVGPITLVTDFSTNVSLSNAYGRTCATIPVGREFINVPMPTPTLEPGQSVETILEFTRSEGEPITFTTKVLAGPGER